MPLSVCPPIAVFIPTDPSSEDNNTGTMTIVGQGTNSRVHLGYASSFSHDTETQNVSSTPQSPPAGAPSHLIHRDILCQNSKVSMTFDHLDAVSPNLSGQTATPYMVNQTMDQRDVPVGPSLLPYQVPAYYHDSQDFMNAGAPSTAASFMNKMVALAESDLLGSLSARTAAQHRAIDAGPSLLPVAPTPLSVPHARGLALTPTPPPFPISPTPSQSMVLSPAPTTAPTPPPFIQNPNLIAVPVPSTVPSPTKTLDVYPSRQPKPLQYIPITRVPVHPTHIANPDGMRRGEQSTAASASTEVSIREPAACYGTTLSAPPAPNTVANQASPSPVAKIVQTFHPTQSPPLNVNTSSPTCSTSTEAAGSLLLKVQEILEKLNLGRLSVQPSPLSRSISSAFRSTHRFIRMHVQGTNRKSGSRSGCFLEDGSYD